MKKNTSLFIMYLWAALSLAACTDEADGRLKPKGQGLRAWDNPYEERTKKEVQLIWVFTRYYTAEELRIFFYPVTDEQVPFRSLVLTHYRKAEFTDKLAEMCGYGLHNFRKVFKKEFGMWPYKWLMMKRAENIKYKLSQTYIPFSDIIDKFNFSSAAHFSNFCKCFLGDTPSNIRKASEKS